MEATSTLTEKDTLTYLQPAALFMEGGSREI